MRIVAGYCRRAALATLASVGLVIPISHPHMRSLVISTAQASPTRPPAASDDGQDQGKPKAGLPSAGLAAPWGAFVAPSR